MSFWTGKKVLVTGAAGFAGSHLCRSLLEAGAIVRAFVKVGENIFNIADIKSKVQVVRGDLIDHASIVRAMKDIDLVFHLGAIVNVQEAREVPHNTFNVNALGTFNVAWAAMNENVKRMLYTSTCHVYGNQPENRLPLKEDAPPNSQDVYSAAKYAGEIACKPFISQGHDIIITRAFNHYGPNQTGDYFVPRVITQVLRGQRPKLGSPKPTRDYCYVKNIVEGYMLAMELGSPGEIYHFSSGKETSIGEFCEKIIEACGADGNINPIWDFVVRKHDIMRSFGDYSKAKNQLGWEPKISLREGLKLTVEWWRRYPELLKV